MNKRLESLDVLRGADLFFLLALAPLSVDLSGLLMCPGLTSARGSSIIWSGRGSRRGISLCPSLSL